MEVWQDDLVWGQTSDMAFDLLPDGSGWWSAVEHEMVMIHTTSRFKKNISLPDDLLVVALWSTIPGVPVSRQPLYRKPQRYYYMLQNQL